MFIGLTGPLASGKGVAADFFKARGFDYISLSNMVRQECSARGLEQTRENLQNIGNDMREKFGSGILAERILEYIKKTGGEDWIIDGVRNPAEVKVLRKEPTFKLLAVTASQDILIERVLSRERSDDPLRQEEIIKRLKRDWGEGEHEGGQQVGKCVALADFTIINEGTMEEYERQLALMKIR